MFALATVVLFFLPFGDTREPRVYDYYKSIFGWTDLDCKEMSFAVYWHGGKAADYLAYHPKLTKKINSQYNIWTHLSPESKKFVQNFNELLFDEGVYLDNLIDVIYQKSNFSKLKPYVESLSNEARQELCEVYKGFEALLKEFGKKCDTK